MRPGGGHHKGSAWERDVGRLLSLWLTNSERDDIFSRNVLSGGAFTIREKQGRHSSRMPGDIAASHPLAFAFLSLFAVECKHLRDIGLEAYLFDPRAQTDLGKIVGQADRQAHRAGLAYMIIAKQNRRDAMVLTDGATGKIMLTSLRVRNRATLKPMHHFFHNGRVMMLRLRDMLAIVDATTFLANKTKANIDA